MRQPSPDPRSPVHGEKAGLASVSGDSPSTGAGERVKASPVNLVAPADVVIAFALPILTAISWALPEPWWRRIGAAVAPLSLRMLTADPASAVRRIGEVLRGQPVAASAETIVEELAGASFEATLQYLRDYRPGGWNPALRLSGREHVEAALGRGSGVILWLADFVFRDVPTKIAFHRAGYAVSHLSHPRHGLSETRLGMRILNRVPAVCGDRYLRERVMLSLDGAVAAMRTLQRRLRENGVVSITAGMRAQHPVAVPLLGREIPLAPGAPDLAHRTKAALLPVFPVRDSAGLITVTVHPPIEVPDNVPRRAASAAAARQFAALLEAQVLEHPGQWLSWFDFLDG